MLKINIHRSTSTTTAQRTCLSTNTAATWAASITSAPILSAGARPSPAAPWTTAWRCGTWAAARRSEPWRATSATCWTWPGPAATGTCWPQPASMAACAFGTRQRASACTCWTTTRTPCRRCRWRGTPSTWPRPATTAAWGSGRCIQAT